MVPPAVLAPALVAGKWFFALVNEYVSLELVGVGEGRGADLALVRPLARVYA